MPSLAADLTKAIKSGGNLTIIQQVKVHTDGTYIDATAADVFGAPAGTGHVVGNQPESDFKRQSDGSRVLNVTIVEQDLVRQNMLELLCPDAGAASASDELRMEDDSATLGGSGSSYNSNNPVFAVYHFNKGRLQMRHGFIQFKPEGGHDGYKAKQWNLIKLSAYTIDANGSPAPTLPVDAIFDDFTIAALVAPYKHSKVFEAA